MEHIDRSKDEFLNYAIYKNFDEKDVIELTDEEFEILRNKMKNYVSMTEAPPASFFDFFEGTNGASLKGNGDNTDFQIYKRISMATSISRLSCYFRYECIFSFINTLEVKNIYDIGCGSDLQAALLVYHPGLTYTGIDIDGVSNVFDEFTPETAYINETFQQFTGSDRIRYIQTKYPCELSVEKNNIAILIGVLGWVKHSSVILSSIQRNFERVILDVRHHRFNEDLKNMPLKEVVHQNVKTTIDVFEEELQQLKITMPEFTFYQIGKSTVFGTKKAEDIEKLANKYTCGEKTVKAWVLEKGWAGEVLK